MNLSINEILKATGGVLRQGLLTVPVTGVSTDSRMVLPEQAFFALKGPSFDGHDFVKDVFGKGATVAVVEAGRDFQGLAHSHTVIEVNDTLKALGDVAAYVRGLYRIPVIAVSGSAGKTTTKEMIAAILRVSKRVLKTEGNKNNLIGLPLTIFGLDESYDAAVLELGISEMWEMKRLVEIARPKIGLITNIGRGHLKTLGSLDGVARAKGPLFTSLGPNGIRIVNIDDPWVLRIAEGLNDTITYSATKNADVRAVDYKASGDFGAIEATYDVRGKRVTVKINSPGLTSVLNGAAAIAATLPLGVSLEEIKEGLSSFSPVHGRMEVFKVNGLTVLDDTYNANPESMSAALKTLEKAGGRKIAVLGDMLELGDASGNEHRSIGRLTGTLGIDVVIAIGEWSKELAEAALSAGVKTGLGFKDKKDAITVLKSVLREGDSVLVKGSRGIRLEEVVEGIKQFRAA